MVDDSSRSPLAVLLRQHRRAKDFTQASLAKATHGAVSLAHVGLIETGARNASPAVVAALAKALGLTDDEHAELLAAAGHSPATGPPADEPGGSYAALSRRLDAVVSDLGGVVEDVAQIKQSVDRILRLLPGGLGSAGEETPPS